MLPTEQQDYPGFSTIACVELGNIGRNYLLRQGQPQSQQRLRLWNQVSDEMDSGSTVLPFDVIHQQKNHLAPHFSPLTLCAGRSRRL